MTLIWETGCGTAQEQQVFFFWDLTQRYIQNYPLRVRGSNRSYIFAFSYWHKYLFITSHVLCRGEKFEEYGYPFFPFICFRSPPNWPTPSPNECHYHFLSHLLWELLLIELKMSHGQHFSFYVSWLEVRPQDWQLGRQMFGTWGKGVGQ